MPSAAFARRESGWTSVIALVLCTASGGCVMPREPASDPPSDPPAWHDDPAPSGDDGSDARLTVGIGSIVSNLDGTTESFEAYQYLRQHPIAAKSGDVRVTLIDHPIDADYSVSGSVDGTIGYEDAPNDSALAGGLLMTLNGGLCLGGAFLGENLSHSDGAKATWQKLEVGAGVITVAGIALLVAANYIQPGHTYRWTQAATLKLQRRGTTVDTFVLRTEGSEVAHSEVARLREHTLAPIWSQLAQRIADRIDADGRGT